MIPVVEKSQAVLTVAAKLTLLYRRIGRFIALHRAYAGPAEPLPQAVAKPLATSIVPQAAAQLPMIDPLHWSISRGLLAVPRRRKLP